MKKRNQPILIGSGSVSVKIYKQGDGRFVVAYWVGGRRRRQAFSDYGKAEAEAKRVAESISAGRMSKIDLTSSEIAACKEAMRILKPTGVSLLLCASQFAEAHKKLNGQSLLHAVERYTKMFPKEPKRVTVEEAAKEMLAEKIADGAKENYSRTMKRHLKKLYRGLACAMLDVRENDISDILRALPNNSGRSRNYTRRYAVTLWRWAEVKGYIPKDYLDYKKIASAKEEAHTPEIYTPDELLKLIEAARLTPSQDLRSFNKRYLDGQGLLPLLVLGAFAGLRTSEVQAQLWTDVHPDRGFIRVTEAKPGTPSKRLVPIQPNLSQWIAVCPRPHLVCCHYGNVDAAIGRLAERAKVKWKKNALRHSFISYRLAMVQDVARVALEAGNSSQVIFSNYRELVTKEEAETWFSLVPKVPENVIVPHQSGITP